MDRFDLEQAIASLWNLSDDINLICENLSKEGYKEDKILNSLIGISELNDMRVQRVMDIFEELIHSGVIGNEESENSYADLTLNQNESEEEVKFFKSEYGKASCSKNSF